MTDSDQQVIIVQAQRGDTRSLELVVRSNQGYAYALAFRLLADEDEAEDAVQEAFIKVWKSLDQFDTGQKFRTWLYKIVTNVCLDHLRARKRRRLFSRTESSTAEPEVPDSMDLSAQISNRQLEGIVRSLTADLPETQRLVFTLRDLQDLSVEEVCEVTGMSPETVKSNLYHARLRVRTILTRRYAIRGVHQ